MILEPKRKRPPKTHKDKGQAQKNNNGLPISRRKEDGTYRSPGVPIQALALGAQQQRQ